MKIKLTILGLATAVLLLPAMEMIGQTEGTSHPERLDDSITASAQPSSSAHYVKPSPYVYAAPAAATNQSYQSGTQQAGMQQTGTQQTVSSAAVTDPDAQIVTAQPTLARHQSPARASIYDPDAHIVSALPVIPGQMNEGTLLHAKLQTPLSTTESHFGDTFLAVLTQPVMQNGEVLLPIGSQIRGRIAEVRGGARIGGKASIRLQPDFITLPDGTTRRLNAEVAYLENFTDSHVNSEGTIVSSGHSKAALTAVAASTGGAAATGAVLGGGVGAVVGAGIGASMGTIWWLKRDVEQELPVNTRLVFSLDEPLSIVRAAH